MGSTDQGQHAQTILSWLEAELPRTLPIYRSVQCECAGFENQKAFGKNLINMFVDDVKCPSVIVRCSVVDISKKRKEITVYASSYGSRSLALISIFLQRCLSNKGIVMDPSEALPIMFPCLPRDTKPTIEETLLQNGYSRQRPDENCQMWVQKDGARPLPGTSLPESSIEISIDGRKKNFRIRPLSDEDAHLLDSTWKYRSADSILKIQNIIKKYPTCGIYLMLEESEELVSWSVTYEDGSVGMLYTVEKYRRNGLARSVTQHLLVRRRSFQPGYAPYAFEYIVENNAQSERLSRSLGFLPIQKVDWAFFHHCKKVEHDANNPNLKWERYFQKESLPWDPGCHASALETILRLPESIGGVPDSVKDGAAIDLGCGSGRNCSYMCDFFQKVVGFDVAGGALCQARQQRLETTRTVPEFVRGDIFDMSEATPLADQLRGKFDFLFDLQVFHVLRHHPLGEARLIDCMAELLKPKGYALVIAGWTGAHAGEMREIGPPVVSKREVLASFSRRFDIIKIETGVFDTTEGYEGFPCHMCLLRRR